MTGRAHPGWGCGGWGGYGGCIWVESTPPGEGSSFSFTLPGA